MFSPVTQERRASQEEVGRERGGGEGGVGRVGGEEGGREWRGGGEREGGREGVVCSRSSFVMEIREPRKGGCKIFFDFFEVRR